MKPWAVTFVHNQATTPRSVLAAEFVARQASGLHFGATVRMPGSIALKDLLPEGANIIGSWTLDEGLDLLAEVEDYLMLLDSGPWGTIVRIVAPDPATLERATSQLQAVRPDDTKGVESLLWHMSDGKPESNPSFLPACSWSDIEHNYPAKPREALTALASRTGIESHEGRLILLHGEPGTGKTTAIRALISEWSPWCNIHVITDPEHLFSNPSYLITVLKSADRGAGPTLDRAAGPPRWNLIVAEDADAYLRTDGDPAALGRLLSTTDGLLAQASQALIALSTNERLSRLHPAVTRPGRCLAEIEIGRFNQEEARKWIGEKELPSLGSLALAELFEFQRTGRCLTVIESVGAYL